MRVVHEQEGILGDSETREQRVLATEVEVADSALAQAKGLMFRGQVPEDFALVMDVGGGLLSGGPSRQFVHMLFMRVPIDVVWLVDETVQRTARLSPWTSFGLARADRIIELPAGGAEGVEPGDRIRVERDDE
ncbi:MAG: DUF192 domain-containing protein [Haloarculaceae archaeon]